MPSLKLNLKNEDADDLVNATMTELSILLLFTIGFMAYFVGDALSNIASGTKQSCLFEYKPKGGLQTEERALFRIIIKPNEIIRTMNIADNRHIEMAKKLLSEKAYVNATTENRYAYGDIKKLVAEIGSINAQTARENDAGARPCRFYALYEIHMILPKSRKKIRTEDLNRIVRTKDILNKLSYAALPANIQIVSDILSTIDAQTELHNVKGHLSWLHKTEGGNKYLVIK